MFKMNSMILRFFAHNNLLWKTHNTVHIDDISLIYLLSTKRGICLKQIGHCVILATSKINTAIKSQLSPSWQRGWIPCREPPEFISSFNWSHPLEHHAEQFNIKGTILNTINNLYTTISITWYDDGELEDLTYWDRVTHICVSKLTIISSDNGLLPGIGNTCEMLTWYLGFITRTIRIWFCFRVAAEKCTELYKCI